MTMDKTLYVVEMLRWGNRENHSYVVGIFDSMVQAEQCGEIEKSWRGGKYEYSIKSIALNDWDDKDGWKYKHYEETRPRSFTYSLNMTGPCTLDWYRDRGLLSDGQPTDPYAGGRIDIRGDTESPYGDEYSVSPMRAEDWKAFGAWLNLFETEYQLTYEQLIKTFEEHTGITIRWAK